VELTLEQKRAIAMANARARASQAPTAPLEVTSDMMDAAFKKKVGTGEDVLRAIPAGLMGSFAGMAGNVSPLDAPMRMIHQAADAGSGLMDLMRGKPPQPHPSSTAGPSSPAASALLTATRQDYQPQTRAGRYAKVAGAMLPALAAPGSIPQRIANVILPTIGSEGSREAVQALGGGEVAQGVASTLGGLAGGVAANTRMSMPERVLPAVDDSAMRYVDRVAGKTPLEDLRAASPDLMGAEALGQRGKVHLATLARREGVTGDALNAEVATRQLGRPTRLLDAFANVTGVHPEAAAGDLRGLVQAGRAKAAPLYDQAYAAGPIDTPALRTLMGRPSIRAAMGKAMGIAAEEGRDPQGLGFEVSPGSGDVPEMVTLRNPTAQTWDYVKRGLDDVIDGYRDTTTGKLVLDEKGRATLDTLKALRTELTDANPAYGKALEVSGDYLSADNAFTTAGKDIFNSNLTERQFQDRLAGLSESSREAYRGGIANRFFDLAQNGRLDPKVLKTPRVRAKLRLALGADQANRLIDLASQEGDMLAFERRYAPNAQSATQEFRQAILEQDTASGRGAQIASDVLTKGPRKALGAQMQALIDAFGPSRGLTSAARDVAGEKLMLSPQDLAAALESYRSLPRGRLPAVRVAPDPRLLQFLQGAGQPLTSGQGGKP